MNNRIKYILYIICILILSFYCRRDNCENKYISFEAGQNHINNKEKRSLDAKQKIKLVIVFLHGISENKDLKNKASEYKAFKNYLKNNLKNYSVEFYLPKIKNTITTRLNKNATIIFKGIKKKFAQNKYDKMFIIGHSQGGLLGYALVEKYSKNLKIKGLITIGTPWKGASCLTAESRNDSIFLYLGLKKFTKIYNKDYDGANDLLPDGYFIKSIKKSAKKLELPILVIGSKSNYYKTLLNTKFGSNKLIRFFGGFDDNMPKKLIGSSYNDGLIELDSQLAKGIPFKKVTKYQTKTNLIHHKLVKEFMDDFLFKIFKGLELKSFQKELKSYNSELYQLNSVEVMSQAKLFIIQNSK